MIAIIDYGLGNPGSILNMLRKIGSPAVITRDEAEIKNAKGIIVPGVGSFDRGMENLEKYNLTGILNQQALEAGKPVLGICLGMQLFCKSSEEGTLPGLGWFDLSVKKIQPVPGSDSVRVPHIGWVDLNIKGKHKLFEGFESEIPRFYFVHSYYVPAAANQSLIASVNYTDEFAAAIAINNIMGVQFHPEKSHTFGMRLFRNFVSLSE